MFFCEREPRTIFEPYSDHIRTAGVWGSRASHSRITLTALPAFRKRLFCSLALIELRCEWNSSTCSLFTHTWLSSTYLNGLEPIRGLFLRHIPWRDWLRWRWLEIPSDNRKFVWNGHLGTRRKLLSRTNCRRGMIFWTDKFVLAGSDWSKSSLSLTTSMAR